MARIFVDTNYFLRFLLKDVNDQFQDAKQLFLKSSEGNINLITSLVVFFEVAWVLRKSFPKDKQAFIDSLIKVLSLRIELSERSLLLESLEFFRESSLSFEDCYNLTFSQAEQVKQFCTFDKKLSREFTKISSSTTGH